MSNVDAVLLRELLASANPLPWSVWCGDGGKPLDFGGVTVVRDVEGGVVAKFNREMTTNLVFISDRNDRLACGAVNSLPVLLDELAALQSSLAAAESRAERAVGLLGDARQSMLDVLEEGHSGDYGSTPEDMRPVVRRIDALLKEVSHGKA